MPRTIIFFSRERKIIILLRTIGNVYFITSLIAQSHNYTVIAAAWILQRIILWK